ncbi:hypothetical protein CFC21_049875 [Triticum aestivum]|nr:hypothetical protein CFC21_049875 [Triticum aestivum]
MYPHRPTGEYRLLLQQRNNTDSSRHQTGRCYVFALGSHQPRRYVGCSEIKLAFLDVAVRLRDSLHWYPVLYETESRPWEYVGKSELIIVFDTTTESFRQMRAPPVPTSSRICEMDDTLGIYSCNWAMETVDIWVLHNYESEVWDLKYRVQLPVAQIWGNLEGIVGTLAYWHVTVALSDGDVLLLVRLGRSLFYVDTDGKLIAIFRDISAYKHWLKQTLVPHDFFMTLDGYAADASPFI